MKTKPVPIAGRMTTFAKRIAGRVFPRRPATRTVRIKVDALFAADGSLPPPGGADIFAIAPLVMKQFSQLPQPVNITFKDDEVFIQHPADGEHVLSYGIPPSRRD